MQKTAGPAGSADRVRPTGTSFILVLILDLLHESVTLSSVNISKR